MLQLAQDKMGTQHIKAELHTMCAKHEQLTKSHLASAALVNEPSCSTTLTTEDGDSPVLASQLCG